MTLPPPAALLHLALHLAVPLLAASFFPAGRRRGAALLLLAGWLIDLDHLLADPVYNPGRMSIGFHPLHSLPLAALYPALAVLPRTRLLGAGLLLHLGLDWLDGLRMAAGW